MPIRSYSRSPRSRRLGLSLPVKLVLGGVAALLLLPVVLSVLGLLGGPKSAAITTVRHYPPQLASRTSFAPTREGAVAAATHFEKDYLLADLRDEGTARPDLEGMATPRFRPTLSRLLDELYARVQGNPLLIAEREGTPNVAKIWPVTYTVERYDTQRAHVVIWAATLAGIKDTAAPRISWTRDRVKLVKEARAWFVDDYQALTPIVPQVSRELMPTRDPQFYAAQKGAHEYDLAP